MISTTAGELGRAVSVPLHRTKIEEVYHVTPTNFSNNQRVYDPLIIGDKLPLSCALCSKGKLGRLGHIIPKFVMRWLKFSSKLNSFYFNNKQVKVSDTVSVRILCDKCEDAFSIHERNFTEKYFKKQYRGDDYKINDDVYYFAISVAWRILLFSSFMRGEDGKDVYFNNLQNVMKTYLLKPDLNAEIDVHIFIADEISSNLSEGHYNAEVLKYSINQGAHAQILYGEEGFIATWTKVPLVYFKLGEFYFFVSTKNYIKCLAFDKKFEVADGGRVFVMKYTDEWMGFLHHVSREGFLEIYDSAIPSDIEYNRISRKCAYGISN